MSNLYHLTVFFDSFDEERDLAAVFNQADDWLRYAPNCWIVASDEDAAFWHLEVRKVVGSGGNILIIPLAPKMGLAGMLRQSVWNWMNKHGMGVETVTPPPIKK